MPIVNTAELTGEALNWAVGKAEGLPLQIQPAQYGIGARVFVETPSGQTRYRPIVEWMQCGPLLEKYNVQTSYNGNGFPKSPTGKYWCAYVCKPTGQEERPSGGGPDARTAICRAVVSAVSGPTVDVPEALL